jgi:competence protein ComEC
MWLQYAFVRFFLFFAIGILAAVYFPNFDNHVSNIWLTFWASATIIYVISWLALEPELRRKFANIFGYFSCFLLFLFGFIYTQLCTEKNQTIHFSHVIPEYHTYYEVIINSELQATKSGYKAEVKVLRLATDTTANSWQVASGKMMLYFSCKDNLIKQLDYGKMLIVKGKPTEIMPPMNPEEFDYRNYMANLQIYFYHFVTDKDFVISGEKSLNPFIKYSLIARNYCDKVLRKYIKDDEAYGLATALVLGIKESLTDEVKNAYSNSGIMHILAVSGMHITLLFNMMMYFLKSLRKNPKTKFYVLTLALIVLWFYAFITGLSASVLRAVVMFTFILGAELFSHKIKIYNILAVSAFTMCLINPYMLFDVGFQLSYLAVLGIVFFHPLFYRLLTVRFPIKKKKEHKWVYNIRQFPAWCLDGAWQIVSVSFAAQISTSPIALLYFHQFPNYFLPANLFAIPVSTLIMYGEIALLIFSWWDFAATYIGIITEYLILFLNFGVGIIEKAPYALTSGISVFAWETWLLYVVIVLVVLLFYYRKLYYFTAAFALLISWCGFQFVEYFEQQKQQSFIIYQTPKATAIEFNSANTSIFMADSLLLADKNKLKFHTANYQFRRSITDTSQISLINNKLQYVNNQDITNKFTNKITENFLQLILETDNFNVMVFRKQRILWLKTKMPVSAIPQADYWLITSNNFPKFPKNTIKNMTDSLANQIAINKPKRVIINGSNKYYQVQKFKELAQNYDLSCHFTQEIGAFELNIQE